MASAGTSNRREWIGAAVILSSALVAPTRARSSLAVSDPSQTGAGKPGDWDFLTGSWRVRHRKLKSRLAGSTDWEEFDGTSVNGPLMGGAANVEDNLFHAPAGDYRGVAVRALDPETGLWAIWWLDSRAPHKLDSPVRGSFRDGVGTFFADDDLNGRPIKVRFLWSRITRSSAQWEQASSEDGGQSWETNWVMQFRRTA